jgi:hypothetical protein
VTPRPTPRPTPKPTPKPDKTLPVIGAASVDQPRIFNATQQQCPNFPTAAKILVKVSDTGSGVASVTLWLQSVSGLPPSKYAMSRTSGSSRDGVWARTVQGSALKVDQYLVMISAKDKAGNDTKAQGTNVTLVVQPTC